MRTIVTGAFGFVGQHLIPHLLEQGDEVIGTFIGPAPQNPPCPAIDLDITNSFGCQRLISDFKPDTIYHLAGIAFVPDAEKDFHHTLATNVGGTYNIYRACDVLKQKASVVFISSGEVYGKVTPQQVPVTESAALKPANNYSLSKAMGELIAMRFASSGEVRPVIMRAFNHIGPGQHHSFVVSSFAKQLAQIKLGLLPPVVRVGNLEARKDFTDVRDIVKGYRLAAQKGFGVYNMCSGVSVRIREILDTLILISGMDVAVEIDPLRYRPLDVPEMRGSFERAHQELGWQPSIPLRKSLEDAFNYWLKT